MTTYWNCKWDLFPHWRSCYESKVYLKQNVFTWLDRNSPCLLTWHYSDHYPLALKLAEDTKAKLSLDNSEKWLDRICRVSHIQSIGPFINKCAWWNHYIILNSKTKLKKMLCLHHPVFGQSAISFGLQSWRFLLDLKGSMIHHPSQNNSLTYRDNRSFEEKSRFLRIRIILILNEWCWSN